MINQIKLEDLPKFSFTGDIDMGKVLDSSPVNFIDLCGKEYVIYLLNSLLEVAKTKDYSKSKDMHFTYSNDFREFIYDILHKNIKAFPESDFRCGIRSPQYCLNYCIYGSVFWPYHANNYQNQNYFIELIEKWLGEVNEIIIK